MDNIKTKLLNNTKDINNNLGVGLEYLFSFSLIIFTCMLYNFIIAIFALHFVNEYSNNKSTVIKAKIIPIPYNAPVGESEHGSTFLSKEVTNRINMKEIKSLMKVKTMNKTYS